MKSLFLKIYRREMGLRQAQMSKLLKIKPTFYNMIENGKRGISLNLFQRIVLITGKTMEQVYSDAKLHEVTIDSKCAVSGLRDTA